MYDFLPVLIFRFFFSSNLFNYRFPYCILLYTWPTQQVIVAQHICADSLRRLILQCSPQSIILTSSHKGRWFPFSFHIYGLPYPTLQSHLVLLLCCGIFAYFLIRSLQLFGTHPLSVLLVKLLLYRCLTEHCLCVPCDKTTSIFSS